MTPDDPRHGTKPGYNSGCRKECCRHAQMVSVKRHRLGMSDSLVDARPTIRRLQALAALGYTNAEMAEALGKQDQWFTNRMRYPTLRGSSAKIVHDLYERWSMTIPRDSVAAKRARMRAARKGWVPPLAWDDIDNLNEVPSTGKPKQRRHSELRAEYRFLSAAGESDHAIARSLGVTAKSLGELMRRNDRRVDREAA